MVPDGSAVCAQRQGVHCGMALLRHEIRIFLATDPPLKAKVSVVQRNMVQEKGGSLVEVDPTKDVDTNEGEMPRNGGFHGRFQL